MVTDIERGMDVDTDEVDELLARARAGRFRWRWVAVAAVVALVVGWAFVAGRSLGRDPRAVESPLLGKPAPALRLPALDGGTVDSADWRGDIVVVNFWSSWCVPCRAEAPELQAFAERWDGRGVRLVGIAYSDEESEVNAFRDRYGLTYPQALDRDGRTAIDFGVFGVPETYVIARDGTVMAKLIGAVDAATLDRVVESVDDGRTVSQKNDRYRTSPE